MSIPDRLTRPLIPQQLLSFMIRSHVISEYVDEDDCDQANLVGLLLNLVGVLFIFIGLVRSSRHLFFALIFFNMASILWIHFNNKALLDLYEEEDEDGEPIADTRDEGMSRVIHLASLFVYGLLGAICLICFFFP